MFIFAQAGAKYQKAHSIDPNNFELLYNWGNALLYRGKAENDPNLFQQACNASLDLLLTSLHFFFFLFLVVTGSRIDLSPRRQVRARIEGEAALIQGASQLGCRAGEARAHEEGKRGRAAVPTRLAEVSGKRTSGRTGDDDDDLSCVV